MSSGTFRLTARAAKVRGNLRFEPGTVGFLEFVVRQPRLAGRGQREIVGVEALPGGHGPVDREGQRSLALTAVRVWLICCQPTFVAFSVTVLSMTSVLPFHSRSFIVICWPTKVGSTQADWV